MVEIWKDIDGYEGLYQVSNLGRVKSLNYNHTGKERIRSSSKSSSGYCQIVLSKDGKKKIHLIHRLVAMAFVDGYEEGLVVNHIDEDKNNNVYTNLEWCTQKENMKHSYRKITEINRVSVRCIETGEVFPTLTKASEFVGRVSSGIIQAIERNGRCGGYHWEYVE